MKPDYIVGFILLATAYFIIHSFFIEPNNIQVPYEHLTVKSSGKPIILVHLSDMHIKGWGELEEDVISKVKETNPDFIVITGDFVNHTKRIPLAAKFIDTLSRIAPVYGVMGNNDYTEVDTELLADELTKAGLKLLFNESFLITLLNGQSLNLVGIDDLKSAILGMDSALPSIVLAHSPDMITQLKEYPVDVLLSGHTHGGQICLPLIGPVITHTKLGRRYASGLFEFNGTYLYVNRGLGMSVLPARVLARPEIAVISVWPPVGKENNC